MPSWILPAILGEGMCCQNRSELCIFALEAAPCCFPGKWLQIKLTIVKSSMLSVTTAGHSALLTSIILPIPSGVTPYKCHAGRSHLYLAVTSNTHVWSSLGHSPLPIKWHYFEKVLEFTVSMSMVNTVVQELPPLLIQHKNA